jgi:ubiquinone/menaquinone biosynthesis C-methylase UbiE
MSFEQGFEFDHFVQRPMYKACPRWLIDHCGVNETSTVADLGCGSGIVTRLLLDQFRDAPQFRVNAIDPSEWELAIAKRSIADPRVSFIQGRAQEARRLIPSAVDAVFLCNVLHQIPLVERRGVLEGAFELVRPRGHVGANTLFYDGAVAPGTQDFYTRWLAETRALLKRRGIGWQVPAQRPIALQVLSLEQHRDLFAGLGFEAIEIEELQFDWTVDDWAALSRYSVFVQGVLWPTVDVAIASEALISGLELAYRGLGLSTVRRGWLQCAARRPA